MKIGVFLPESPWGEIDEAAMDQGLGGRETALVHLSVEWARYGHEVYAFVPRSTPSLLGIASEIHHGYVRGVDPGVHGNVVELSELPDGAWQTTGFVRWIPYEQVLNVAPLLGLDLFVSWENVEVFKQLGLADVGTRVIEMQVAHLAVDEPDDLRFVDQIAVLSPWARDFLKTQLPGTRKWQDDETYPIFPNGVDLSRFDLSKDQRITAHDKLPPGKNFIYSSSPDRGLHHLLTMWPEIRANVYDVFEVDAHLHVCYGAEEFVRTSRWAHNSSAERALAIERLMDSDGVVYHGKIGQHDLAELMVGCDGLVYPFDPMSPTETGCITIVEALAAGLPVATTDGDCLGEDFGRYTYQVPLPLNYSEYLMMVVQMLGNELVDTEVNRRRRDEIVDFVATRDWHVIAADWINHYKYRRSTVADVSNPLAVGA